MPVKRRASKSRQTDLNPNQESYLLHGTYFFGLAGPEFEDDEHVRAAWERHRDRLMVFDPYPGRRPWAYWEYDQPWPAGSESQSDAVHRLPDTSAEERARIEEDWLRAVNSAASRASMHPPERANREYALFEASYHGAPKWFVEKHFETLYRRHLGESEAWQRRIRGNA